MTRRSDPDRDALQRAVEREEKLEETRREGEPAIWENLSMLGALGWLIVLPPLVGGLLGHWLDTLTGYPVLWAAIGIVVGIVLGFVLALQRMLRK